MKPLVGLAKLADLTLPLDLFDGLTATAAISLWIGSLSKTTDVHPAPLVLPFPTRITWRDEAGAHARFPAHLPATHLAANDRFVAHAVELLLSPVALWASVVVVRHYFAP
jgi:hypothetical protein